MTAYLPKILTTYNNLDATTVTYEARKACLHQAFRASFTLAASLYIPARKMKNYMACFQDMQPILTVGMMYLLSIIPLNFGLHILMIQRGTFGFIILMKRSTARGKLLAAARIFRHYGQLKKIMQVNGSLPV